MIDDDIRLHLKHPHLRFLGSTTRSGFTYLSFMSVHFSNTFEIVCYGSEQENIVIDFVNHEHYSYEQIDICQELCHLVKNAITSSKRYRLKVLTGSCDLFFSPYVTEDLQTYRERCEYTYCLEQKDEWDSFFLSLTKKNYDIPNHSHVESLHLFGRDGLLLAEFLEERGYARSYPVGSGEVALEFSPFLSEPLSFYFERLRDIHLFFRSLGYVIFFE
jgi:hypothetical protein